MSSVRLSGADRRAIFDAARAARPEEACGILIGRRSGEATVVEAVEPTPNGWSGDRRHRYEIPPARLLAAHRAARAAGREVVGYFHSHPGGRARPSAFDRERAWPETLYLIAAVDAFPDEELRAFRLGAAGGFVEEAIE